MPTLNQQKAAISVKEAMESGEKTDGGSILEKIGYSPSIAKNPKMIFKSKGFKEALKQLGFSVGAADMTVAKILRTGKEENQLRASDMIYKRFAAYEEPEGGKSTTIQVLNINYVVPGNNTNNSADPKTTSGLAEVAG